jgi:hypothetical protein
MRRSCTVAVAIGVALALPGVAHATTYPVTSTNEADLRAAFDAANDLPGADTIQLAGQTIVLSEGDLDVLDDLTLRGPGTIDGSGLEEDGILEVYEPLTIEDLRLVNSSERRAVLVWQPVEVRVSRGFFAGNDGAIGYYPQTASRAAMRLAESSLIVSDSTFEDNVARTGGALDLDPGWQTNSVTVVRSTFSGNRAVSDGEGVARGGAINLWSGMLDVENSTFSGNVAQGPSFGSGGGAIAVNASATLTHVTIAGNLAEGGARGGGIAGPRFEEFGAQSFVPVTVSNSIVAGNTSEVIEENRFAAAAAAVRSDDCDATVGTGGGNLESATSCGFRGQGDKQNTDPQLAALAANGGPTRTMALGAGSPALDAALAAKCAATDQRGIARVAAACDSGAYEYVAPGTQPTTQTPPTAPAGGVLGERARSECLSNRRFKIRLRVPRGEKVRKATVLVNGKKVKVRRGKRLTAIVDLRGLPKKRYRVEITLKLVGGETVSGVRRYWTCTPAIRWTKPPKV